MATVSLGAIRPSEPRKGTAAARPKSAIERGIDSSAAELLVPASETARVDRARQTSSLAANAPSPPGARTGGRGAEERRRPIRQDIVNCTRKPNQPALSRKLRVSCGPALRTHLRRQGVAVEEEMTPRKGAKLRTVFDLLDHSQRGRVDAGLLDRACELLGVLQTDKGTPGGKHLDFREFSLEMRRRGFGAGNVLDELYDPATRELVEEQRSMRVNAGTIDPSLALLREKRNRTVSSILHNHLERRRQTFGSFHQQHDEESEEDVASILHKPFASTLLAMDRNNASKKRAGSSKGSTGSDAAANMRGGGGQDMAETSAQHLDTHVSAFSVLVIEARNLPAPALIPQVGGHRRPPDTWVVCEYGSSSQRTFPRRGTMAPQWNSTLAFRVDANSVQITAGNRDNSPATNGTQPGILQGPDLIVSLKSSDPTDPHQESPVVVGSVTIQPREIVTPSQGAEGWFKLVPPDKRSATNFKTEVYLIFKPHLRPKRPLESPPSSTEGHDINATEAENMRRMQALLAWEKGDTRVESDASRRDLAKALSARRLFVPPGTSLSALCSRSIPIRTSAHDVLAKLQTPFTRHFSAKSLEPGADDHEEHRLAALIRKNKGLRSLGQRSAMVQSENRGEFQRIAVGEGFCVAIDPNHIVFIWGAPESKLVQLAGKDLEKDTIQDQIRNDYRARIELESDGLSAQEAAVLTRRLEDEKELYLNDIEAYITRTLARPHVVKTTRHLAMFDVVAGAEHALLLTKEGQVFAVGQGNCGKLGLGGLWDEAVPRLVEALAKRRTIQIACGINHSAAVTDNGSVWTWGDNRFGQLGHGNNRDLATPTRVRTLEAFGRVANVACGHNFSAAVLANGQLYTWGLGWHGQLGHAGVSDAGERDVQSKSPRRAAAPQQETKKKTDASNRDDDAFRFGGGGPGKKNRADVEEKAMLESYLDRFHFFEAKMECDLGHTRSAAKNEDPPKKGHHCAGKEKGKNEERNAGRARSCVTPHLVSALAGKSITSIACGARHMLATEAPNGSTDCVAVYNVFSWGQGAQGQLGHGVAHSEMDPRPIHDARGLPVFKVAAGQMWSAIFVSESEAFLYGLLDYGCGVGEAGAGLAFRDLSVAVNSSISGKSPICSNAQI